VTCDDKVQIFHLTYGGEVYIPLSNILAWMTAMGGKETYIEIDGAQGVHVKETPEEVYALIQRRMGEVAR
jgi:hypothetical protein